MESKEVIYYPVAGKMIPLSEVKDEMFKEEMLGPTISIKANANDILSPFDGVVSAFYPSKHAVGIQANNGLQILIHVGIDTSVLDGRGFSSNIKQGSFVKAHDQLIHFDQKFLEKQGYDCTVFMIVLNSKEYKIDYRYETNFTEKDVIAYAERI